MSSTPPFLNQTTLLGYPVHVITMAEGLAFAEHAMDHGETLHVVTLNPEMIMQGEDNPPLGTILKSANLILPDGAGVVWALKKFGFPQVQRLPGIEFSESILKSAEVRGDSVAIIGAKPETLTLAVENLKQRHPGLNIVYAHHGYFKDGEESDSIAQACAEAKPKIVLVALGVPKQEQWIAANRNLFEGAVLIGIGGSLDVWSGNTNRAPLWFRRLNLEWLYRITSEPWRIKRVYKTLPMFVIKVLQSGPGPR